MKTPTSTLNTIATFFGNGFEALARAFKQKTTVETQLNPAQVKVADAVKCCGNHQHTPAPIAKPIIHYIEKSSNGEAATEVIGTLTLAALLLKGTKALKTTEDETVRTVLNFLPGHAGTVCEALQNYTAPAELVNATIITPDITEGKPELETEVKVEEVVTVNPNATVDANATLDANATVNTNATETGPSLLTRLAQPFTAESCSSSTEELQIPVAIAVLTAGATAAATRDWKRSLVTGLSLGSLVYLFNNR